ncbi:malonate decarboxylase subunit delta [Undibacterium sp.]|jgi:malonate decarboxylase delta subunit|uniref:malonate decarboxylase subunit delta n=1 Tax=Undibacterium sp. TaxID=1914977 RepID=UPI002BFF529E|nr:malonate decarboxylase subunit delta [Undibacterium sp.]HTD03733.1 malonate decarboxylase subunit delta [Undibacterium sp.]
MEKIFYEYPAGEPAKARVLTGVVGSGDLEVLLEPRAAGATSVAINTSVDGMGQVWAALLTRIFTASPLPAAKIEINDFGATPGVVRMRIEQAFEELQHASAK